MGPFLEKERSDFFRRNYLDKRNKDILEKRLVKRLEALGNKVIIVLPEKVREF